MPKLFRLNSRFAIAKSCECRYNLYMENTVKFKTVYNMTPGEKFTYFGSYFSGTYKFISFSEGSYSNHIRFEDASGKISTIMTSKFHKFRCI